MTQLQPPPEPESLAAVVAAQGATITLADGTQAQLRYTMRSLDKLEQDFGSVEGVIDAFDAVTEGKQARGPVFGPIVRLMVPGLFGAWRVHPATGELYELGATPDRAAELLDPAQVGAYAAAIGRAIKEAFGALALGPPGAQEPPPGSTAAGPGPSGSTPPPSSTDAARPSSGA